MADRFEPYHRRPGQFDERAIGEGGLTDARGMRQRSLTLRRAAVAAAPAPSTTVSPVDFGGDPTGNRTSSTAFNLAITAMLALASPNRKDPQGHLDLGGATLDLRGGIFLIDEPVAFPVRYSNFRIEKGTLVAAETFPRTEFMVTVGASGLCPELRDTDCNRDVDISQLTVDGNARAWGAILVNHTVNVNVGPAILATGFRGVGISLAGSGAGLIHHAWLGEIPPASPLPRSTANATAISLESGQHDAMVSDVIIWSAKVGIKSYNGANRLQGVHAWNLAGKDGGTGIEIGVNWGGASGGRVQNCYLDYAPLVVKNPGNLLVSDNLFLGSSSLVLEATKETAEVRNVIITGNTHHTGNTGNQSLIIDERHGRFTTVVDTVIESNEVDATDAGVGKVGSRATLSAKLAAGDTATTLWFAKYLAFNVTIDPASVQCWLHGPHATALSAEVVYEKAVQVALKDAVPQTTNGVAASTTMVICSVDQSVRSCPAH